MTGVNEHVDLEGMRDLRGRALHPWIRVVLLAPLVVADDQDTAIELDDETTPIARVAHTTTVLP
jgi:hypothetical protein